MNNTTTRLLFCQRFYTKKESCFFRILSACLKVYFVYSIFPSFAQKYDFERFNFRILC